MSRQGGGGAGDFYRVGLDAFARGDLEVAESAYRDALRVDPRNADLLCDLGHLLQRMGRAGEAIGFLRRGLKLQPARADLHATLAAALLRAGRNREALEAASRAVRIDPGYATGHNNLGHALVFDGDLEAAQACFRRALQADAQNREAHYNLALALLLRGQFSEGWREFRWRMADERPAAWQETMRGRDFCLVGEQGLGDQLFFLRFAPRLKALGAGGLIARVDPRLVPMLARTGLFRTVAGTQAPVPAGAIQVPVGDLPGLSGMAGAGDAAPSLRLAPDPAALEAARAELARLGPPPYIGVTWSGGLAREDGTRSRTLPPQELARALQASRATIVVLQRGAGAEQVAGFGKALGRAAHDLPGAGEDLERLLALLSLLDDYIGVSNTNMHLRAGTGLGAKVLVPIPPQWRWMAEGDTSPWFPGTRVYRQARGGSWDDALARLARDLGG